MIRLAQVISYSTTWSDVCAQLLMREWSRKRKGCLADVISPPVPGSHPLVNHASLFTAPLLTQKQYPLSRNHPWNRRLHTCLGPWGAGAKGCVITATNGVAGVHLLWKTNIRSCALYSKLHKLKNCRHRYSYVLSTRYYNMLAFQTVVNM